MRYAVNWLGFLTCLIATLSVPLIVFVRMPRQYVDGNNYFALDNYTLTTTQHPMTTQYYGDQRNKIKKAFVRSGIRTQGLTDGLTLTPCLPSVATCLLLFRSMASRRSSRFNLHGHCMSEPLKLRDRKNCSQVPILSRNYPQN